MSLGQDQQQLSTVQVELAGDIWHTTRYMHHITRDIGHLIHGTWHMTHDAWHLIYVFFCICATIRARQEIQFLPHAGFFLYIVF